jgi:L-ascorbate metabolism protein UlaG (beta-lactamase superfamily)
MRKALLTIILALVMATGCTAALKSDTFTTKNGKEVKITCIKHASIQIEYDDLQIQVDPVIDGAKPITDYTQFPKANIILVTHEHHDHFDRDAISMLKMPATAVYLTNSIYSMYHNGFVMRNGESISYRDDVTIEAVPAYNTTEGREQFHPKGRDNGYVLTLDGLRIYIAGDTEDIPEMAQLKDIDIAFLPCNQPYTMTVDQLVKAANTIKPKVLFPYHYSETPIAQVRLKMVGSNVKVLIRDYK